MTEICFIEARPRVVATGTETVVRLAGGGAFSEYYRGGQHYRAGIATMPRFAGGLGYDDNGWNGATLPTSGALEFAPSDNALITELLAHYWRDAAITIDAGEETTALARRLTGAVAAVVAGDGKLTISFQDPGKLVDKPILGTGFAGTGGIEGPNEATGRAKRRSIGRVFNVEGRLVDKANNIFEFGDPAFPLQAIVELRDKGRAGATTTIAWQGTIAATFAALQAAAAPQGGGVVAPSIACAKWWTDPAGPLTADLLGENTGGYVENAVAIAARLLVAVGGPAIANQAAAEALRTAAHGIHIDNPAETVAQAIDRLLLGSSLYWILQPAGTVRIGEWAWGAPVASFQAVFIGRERELPPIKSRKVGYKANRRPHGAGEISAALGRMFVQSAAPTATQSAPGDTWQAADGAFYTRLDTPLLINGDSLLIGGSELDLVWTLLPDQPLTTIAQAAANAQAAAAAAQAAADVANGKLAEIASDSLLTPGEKPQVILQRDTIVAEQAGIDAQATALAITAEKVAYDDAIAALVAYLATLAAAVPWNDLGGNTDIVGATFRSRFADVFAARQALLNKISAVTKARADQGVADAAAAQLAATNAQTSASLANAVLQEIASDSLLTPGEKPRVIRDRDVLIAEQAGIDAGAAALGITTEKVTYDNAVSALTTYLATLTTPFLWSNLGGNTDIVGATFRTKFADVFTARQALLDKMYSIAAQRATWGGIAPGGGKPEDGADVTANAQVAVVPPGDFTLSRTWDGIVKAGQLPIDKSPVVTRGGVDKRTDNGTSYAIVTATGGLAGGKVSINNTNGSADKGTLTFADTIESGGLVGFTVAIAGVTYGPFVINVTTVDDNAPINNGASGGIDSSLAMVSNTTYSVMTGTDSGDPVLDVVITGPTQTLKLWAAFSYFKGGGGSLAMTCTAEYYNGSAWVSMGAEVTGSLAQRYFDGDLETWVMEPGALSYAWSVTGLSAGTYPVRLLGKKASSTTGTLTPATGKVTSSRV